MLMFRILESPYDLHVHCKGLYWCVWPVIMTQYPSCAPLFSMFLSDHKTHTLTFYFSPKLICTCNIDSDAMFIWTFTVSGVPCPVAVYYTIGYRLLAGNFIFVELCKKRHQVSFSRVVHFMKIYQ